MSIFFATFAKNYSSAKSANMTRCFFCSLYQTKREYSHKERYQLMSDNRILFVSQEISPYLPSNEISDFGHKLPQSMQESGYEVRIFMPKYGSINERRNQLHEVIRLSGMNISIDDSDHPLIIKVASMQPGRIQVYFIDNDDFFQKLASDDDPEGSNRIDNDERSIFFARGTMETVKKLRWEPSIVHCAGWITALSPMYLRRMYADDPSFTDAKIVYSVTPRETSQKLNPKMLNKLVADGMPANDLNTYSSSGLDTQSMHKMAIEYSDAVVFHTPEPNPELLEIVRQRGIPYLTKEQFEQNIKAHDAFYKSLLGNEK